MSLTDILNDAVDSLPEVQFAGVVGTDGLRIEVAYADEDSPCDLDLAELELATLAAAAGAASARIGSGPVHALTLETDELTYIAIQVTPGYFAIVGLLPNGDPDEARDLVEDLAGRVREEL